MEPLTHIDFCIRGDDLQLDAITQRLGVNPTSGFNPFDLYMSKEKVGDHIITVERQRPSFGVWHVSTIGLVASPHLEDHAKFLLSKLQPAEQAIGELMQTGIYRFQLTFWHVGPSGFDLQSVTMGRLAKLCDRMSFTFFEVSDIRDPEQHD